MREDHLAISFGSIEVMVDPGDPSARMYGGPAWFEEFHSRFHSQIATELNPDLLLDIGANYGVASVFMKRAMPDTPLISVEANPTLIPYIEHNLKAANASRYDVRGAVMGSEPQDAVSFHINPNASQDSRVVSAGAKWARVYAPQVSIDSLIAAAGAQSAYIKIDCQGYEEPIFKGARQFLTSSDRWLIKTEFAPMCLKSQGTDPLAFLTYLTERYAVAEFPARYGFKTDYRDLLQRNALEMADCEAFLEFVLNLNRNERGWLDLLVGPRPGMLRSD